MVVREHESISRLADYRPKNVPRISQRLVNTSLGDFKGRNVAVARVQQNNAQNLLVEKLHIGAGSIDRSRNRRNSGKDPRAKALSEPKRRIRASATDSLPTSKVRFSTPDNAEEP